MEGRVCCVPVTLVIVVAVAAQVLTIGQTLSPPLLAELCWAFAFTFMGTILQMQKQAQSSQAT